MFTDIYLVFNDAILSSEGGGGSTIMTEIFVIFSSTFNGWQQSLEVGLHVFITETERLDLFKNFISDEQKGC